jgi:hypothetical protein
MGLFDCCLVVGCQRGCRVLLAVLVVVMTLLVISWCYNSVDLLVVVVGKLVVGGMRLHSQDVSWGPPKVWACCIWRVELLVVRNVRLVNWAGLLCCCRGVH